MLDSALCLEYACQACRELGVLSQDKVGPKAQRKREGRGASVCLRRPCAVPFRAG